MKKTILLLACTLIFSCTKNDTPNYGGVNESGAWFYVKDSQGNNLVDPNTPNAYKENEIKIYHIINGVEKLMYDSNLDNPKFFTITQEDGLYKFGLGMSLDSSVDYPISYIQWNDTDRDTIKTEYLREQGSVIKQKIWFNDQLVWEHEFGKDDYDETISIIK
ncbi:hypothetical protein GCM10011416_11070 [Polaribacter pacificus]|uniref:Uncharacterized protein n=1 Tax=Polaribacter pacificus TaxID=1775173 RepID=A0A917HY56_9FLAO|nr:hypothetical protein [Polaribacter pacificus]GGG95336.1 hypothetical protein GCM10011416_11070 [Polaribacter pacificus]